MSKKVSKAFLVGERSFRAGGDVIHVPEGRHDVDELLSQFPKEDRLPLALLAKGQGVTLEYEATYVDDEEKGLALVETPSDHPASEPPVEAAVEPAGEPSEPGVETTKKRTRKK